MLKETYKKPEIKASRVIDKCQPIFISAMNKSGWVKPTLIWRPCPSVYICLYVQN